MLAPEEKRQAVIEVACVNTLHKLCDLAKRENIELVAFKGISIAYKYYIYPYSRPRRDIDVLVAPSNFWFMMRQLRAAGFRLVGDCYRNHQASLIMADDSGISTTVDLHWRFNNHPGFARILSFEEIFSSSVPHPVFPDARVPCAILELLISIIHLYVNKKAARGTAIWETDIALQWSQLSDREKREFVGFLNRKGLKTLAARVLVQGERSWINLESNELSRYTRHYWLKLALLYGWDLIELGGRGRMQLVKELSGRVFGKFG